MHLIQQSNILGTMRTETSSNLDDATEICFSCLKPNEPGVHFCQHCQTPLTSYATTAPFERIFALGDGLRKAIYSDRWSWPVRIICYLVIITMFIGILFGFMLPA
jgi:hypothetical protein